MALDKVTTKVIADDAVTGAKIENNPTVAGNLTVAGTSTLTGNATASGNLTVTGDIVPSTPLSHRNMIINGAMNVAQRSTSVTNNTSSNIHTVDRFRWNTNDGTFDHSQSDVTGAFGGLTKAMKVSNDVSDTSVDVSHINSILYRGEAQDFLRLLEADGTGTQAFVLSFYAKISTGTGTYSVSVTLSDTSTSANSRYTSSFTVSDANWNRYTIAVPANSVGVINNDNGKGIEIEWVLHAGSNYGGGTTGSWAVSSSSNNRKVSGQTDLFNGGTGRSFELTGVQLELGSSATPFEHRSYAEELRKCQRYMQKYSFFMCPGFWNGSQNARAYFTHHVPMKSLPTLSEVDGSGDRGGVASPYNWSTSTSGASVLNYFDNTSYISRSGFSGGSDMKIINLLFQNYTVWFEAEL